jgi:hypothetical protein
MQISRKALEEVEQALDRYHDAVEGTSLEEKTKRTYVRHADTFVRWLKDEFEPGSRKD